MLLVNWFLRFLKERFSIFTCSPVGGRARKNEFIIFAYIHKTSIFVEIKKYMNILFYTDYEVSPQKGGIERVTAMLASELSENYGMTCFLCYRYSIAPAFIRIPFKYLQVEPENFKEKITSFITENQIDIIFNQSAFYLTSLFREIVNVVRPQCKIIFCHHFAPGNETGDFSFSGILQEIRLKKKLLRNSLNLIFYPIVKRRITHRLQLNYERTYRYSDCVVLLSNKYRDDFMKWGKITDTSKFREIHNTLSFNTFFDMRGYEQKKKTVLIVARINEKQKKISLALKIWRELEKDSRLSDWQLKIVGIGNALDRYRRFVARNNLKRVSFEGLQIPEPYYTEASLFMMTSALECSPLTLIEAQQMGCVPLAFDSFASLPDVITDGENGYIVPYGDLRQYADKMKELMLDANLRRKIAANAIESSKRFERPIIMEQWKSLIDSLML